MTAAAALVWAAVVSWGFPNAPIGVPAGAPGVSAPAPAAVETVRDAAPPVPQAPVHAAADEPVGALQATPLAATPPQVPGEATPPPPPSRKRKNKRRGAQEASPGGDDEDSSYGTFELKGRIFVLGEWQRSDVTVVGPSGVTTASRDAFDVNVSSIRPALRWQAPQKWLTAMIEVEVSARPDLRDGYVQMKGKQLMLRAGQFKMPGSAIELTSPWMIPTVRRGFLHGLLTDGLDTPWRRPGVMLRWSGPQSLHPELSGAIYQGVVTVSEGLVRDKDLIVAQSLSAQGLIGRGQIEPAGGVQVGAYYAHRVGTPAILQTARYWTAGADVVVDRTFSGGGFRMWLDGMAGASWFEHPSKPADGQDTTFLSARSIFAYRFGGVEAESRYLELYSAIGVLDPDTEVTSDLAFEANAGVNVGLWQRLRCSLQGEVYRTGRNFPPGYFLGLDPDHFALLAQLGVNL